MKFTILFSIAFICGVSAQGVNDHLRTFFEQERENFPCGWPDYPYNQPHGLPPLEPFLAPRPWNLHFSTLGSITDMNSVISNVIVRGLMDHVLEDVHLEVIGMWMRIVFSVDVLNVNGNHVTSGLLNQGGVVTPFSGQGPYVSQARQFRINSMIAMNTIQPGNFLNVRAMNSQVTIGSLVTHMDGFGTLTPTINSIVNSAMPGHIAHPDTQARLNQHISEILTPILNASLNRMTMPDLISFLSNRVSNPPPQRCFVRNGIKISM